MDPGPAMFTTQTTEESGPFATPAWSPGTPTSSTWPKRTLTKLYNEPPTWLNLAHKALDEAVFDAYGWDPSMTDEQILAALLELNLERSASSGAAPLNAEIGRRTRGRRIRANSDRI